MPSDSSTPVTDQDLSRKVRELESELMEARRREAATAQILSVIHSSPGELQPVFDAIARSALELCGATFSSVLRFDGRLIHFVAAHGMTPEGFEALRRTYPLPPGRAGATTRAIATGALVEIPDVDADPDFEHHHVAAPQNFKSLASVPMLKDGCPIGTITVGQAKTGRLPEAQIALLRTFADQAIIAIENARLFEAEQARSRELSESLEQQSATAEILSAISSSPTDVQPVFEAIVTCGKRLFADAAISVTLPEGDKARAVAVAGLDPGRAEVWQRPFPLTREYMHGVAILDARMIDVPDVEEAPPDLGPGVRNFLASGYRAVTITPMMRGEVAVGAIGVVRRAPGPLSRQQRELLRTFAEQAVIAIENTRLLNELRESLQQQTATADVLKVISRSAFDLQKVLDALVESAAKLCGGDDVSILRLEDGNFLRVAHCGSMKAPPAYVVPLVHGTIAGRSVLERRPIHVADLQRESEGYRVVARAGFAPEVNQARMQQGPLAVDEASVFDRVALGGRTIHVADVKADPDYTLMPNLFEDDPRTVLGVPLMREGEAAGVIVLIRTTVEPYSQRQIELIETFADQAVIAMNNARLFEEVQARNRDLTALSEVGRAVSSTLDLNIVLRTIVNRAVELSATDGGSIFYFREQTGRFELGETTGLDADIVARFRKLDIAAGQTGLGEAIVNRGPLQIADITKRPSNVLRDAAIDAGLRAALIVPLLSADAALGTLVLQRREPGDFSPSVVTLMQSFANQSAIALENARLFNEIARKSRELEIASQHKSQFVANMSHELRTPLAAILGYAELMEEGFYDPLGQKSLDALARIRSNGKHLLGLINTVLDIAKIESGQFTLNMTEYDIQSIVETVRS
ncbi:MAG: GAF domain-containing protein, partial [Hyphomicrobiaceae bacterium]